MFALHFLVIPFGIFLFSISKSGFSGGGLALAGVTIISIYHGPLVALSVLMPMLLICDAIAAYLNRHKWDKKMFLSMAPFSLLGIIMGSIFYRYINLHILSIFIGSTAIVYTILDILIQKGLLKFVPLRNSKLFWGSLSGFTSFSLHSGGVPMTMYMMGQYKEKFSFISGLVFAMAFINISKVIPYLYLEILTLSQLKQYLVYTPIPIIGVILGHWLNKKVTDRVFFTMIQFFVVVASIKLILTGLEDLAF